MRASKPAGLSINDRVHCEFCRKSFSLTGVEMHQKVCAERETEKQSVALSPTGTQMEILFPVSANNCRVRCAHDACGKTFFTLPGIIMHYEITHDGEPAPIHED